MKTINDVIREVTEEVCDNLCKYSDTSDDFGQCDYMRENGYCPLDKLE